MFALNRCVTGVSLVALMMSSATKSVAQTQNVVWTGLMNVTATGAGNSLQKTSGCNDCPNAGALSRQAVVSGDGYVEFTASETTTQRYLGLSNSYVGGNWQSIPFTLSIGAAAVAVRESGVYKTELTFATGDIFRISVIAGTVRYSKNGSTFYTSTVAPTYPLMAAAALLSLGATINNVVIGGGTDSSGDIPPPWATQDIGSVGVAGSTTYSNGIYFNRAAGSDIWDTADSFRYVYQSLSGDGQIVARVTAEQDTNASAKAGVMIRESLTPGSAHVILDVKPDGEVEFMTRATAGGESAWMAGASPGFPAWLKLVRSGSTVTASVSSNGTSWTIVGTTTLSATTTVKIGLAATSHDPGTLNTSAFDNVSVTGAPPPAATQNGCAATASSVLYRQSWANGAAPVAMPGTYYQNTRWDGANPVDPVYPEIASSESVTVLSGGGPHGENVLDFNPAGVQNGEDYVTTGLVVGGFGPIPDTSGGPSWWDATEGCLSVSYKWTTEAWNQSYYSPLLTVAKSLYWLDGGFSLAADFDDPNAPGGATHGTFDLFYPVNWGLEEIDTYPFTRAATENQWQTFMVQWKNGTMDAGLTSVAADGWLRVYWNGTLIYDFNNIQLTLDPHAGPDGKPNRLRAIWLGYYGLFGPSTNLTLTNRASENDIVSNGWSGQTTFSTATPSGSFPIGFVTGYAVREGAVAPPAGKPLICALDTPDEPAIIQEPLFTPYDRGQQQWWDNLVEEVAFTNSTFLALNVRGDAACLEAQNNPAGGEPPRLVRMAIDAIKRRHYDPFLRIAYFDDTASTPELYHQCPAPAGGQGNFDLSDLDKAEHYFYDLKYFPFFDEIRTKNAMDLVMKVRGRPLAVFWTANDFAGVTGANLTELIRRIRSNSQRDFGPEFDPFIVVDESWVLPSDQHPGVAAVRSVVEGVHGWFLTKDAPACPPDKPNCWFTLATNPGRIGNFTTGVTHPGFWNPPGGFPNGQLTKREGGVNLHTALNAIMSSDLVLLEGFTDVEENAGFYRGANSVSPICGAALPTTNEQWGHPNQYLNIVREHAAPFPQYVIFEAEAADSYAGPSTTPTPQYRRSDGQHINFTDATQSQWAVRLQTSEFADFQDVQLGTFSNGRVRITYTTSAAAMARLHVMDRDETGGYVEVAATDVPLPSTDHTADSSVSFDAGRHTIRLQIIAGEAMIDSWTLDGLGILQQ